MLSRFAQRAVLAFDSDEAGARAAERAYQFQETFPVQAVVMIMPQGLDPADFVAKHGADAVREAAKRSRPLVEYMVRRTVARHDLSTVEGQSAAVADALPILEGLSDPVRRSEYGHLLADVAGVSDSSVMQALERRLGGRPQEIAKTMKRVSAQDKVEREMLKLLARDDQLYRAYVGQLEPDHFRNARNKRTFQAIVEAERRHRRDRRRGGREARRGRVVAGGRGARRRARRRVRAQRVDAPAGVPAEEQERCACACGCRS